MKTKRQPKLFFRKTFEMRSHYVISLACASVLAITACGGNESGYSASTQSSNSATYGAPSVPAPLDVRGIVADPCSALSKQQIGEFPGELDKTHTTNTTLEDDKKTTCAWTYTGGRYSYGNVGGGVVLPSDTYHGISSVYKTEQEESYEVFKPVELAGYPAVINGSEGDTSEGDCRLSVGLRDDTAYRITVMLLTESPEYDEPCEAAKRLGKFVVKNLKEGR